MNKFLLFIGVAILAVSCGNVLDKPVNAEHLSDIKEKIENNDDYSPMKKKYLIKNISDQTGYAALAQAMEVKKENFPTFRDQIEELSTDFDSITVVKKAAAKTNKQLEGFVVLKDAKTASESKFKGNLLMTLNFNNKFEKEILYIILNYKYVNKYDSEFFDENIKLTDEVAGKFDSDVEIAIPAEYNDVAEFMYNEVPVQASLKEREEFGVEEANSKVEREFLMEGIQVSTVGVIFKDKSELFFEASDWEYLD